MKNKKLKSTFIIITIIIIFLIAFIIFYNLFNKTDDSKNIDDKKIKEKTTTTTKRKDDDLMDKITLNYHASIRLEKDNKVIYFDPFKISESTNDADYIFITHSHYDHYSLPDIKKVMKDSTKFIVTNDIEGKLNQIGIPKENITVVYPNKSYVLDDLKFDAISAYNINKTYHKKSYNWVGYNVLIDGIKYYVVGDSDVTDEFKSVTCDVIFVPVGGQYTMNFKEASDAVNEMKPKYAVPIHYGEVGSLEDAKNFINGLNEDIKGVILN